MTNTLLLGNQRLVRDRLTLTLYTSFIAWGWYLYAFSPAIPLIAEEQGISRALAGLHGTAMAGGTLLTGLLSAHLALRLGRRLHSIIGSSVFAGGVALLMVSSTLPATLPATLLVSVGGSLTVTAATPALSVHHGRAGFAAVTEGNGVAAAFGLLAPLALGLSVRLGFGWRPAVAFAAVLSVTAAVLLLRMPPEPALGKGRRVARIPGQKRDGFSAVFWLFWVALICGAGIEFATTFWAPDLLANRTGASASLSSGAVSALVIGMAVSRFVVGPLSLRKAPEKLLLVGYATAGVGWAIFWLATSPVAAVTGLVVAGLGYGAHFPLAISLVLRAAGDRPDQGQARATLGAGAAIGVAPFALGALADAYGPHRAFLLVAFLIVCGGTAVALGLRSVQRAVHRAAEATAAETA
jgi:MFS family permease